MSPRPVRRPGTFGPATAAVLAALVVAGASESAFSQGLGIVAIILAAINVFGGFLVTDRMLQMFRREGPDA